MYVVLDSPSNDDLLADMYAVLSKINSYVSFLHGYIVLYYYIVLWILLVSYMKALPLLDSYPIRFVSEIF